MIPTGTPATPSKDDLAVLRVVTPAVSPSNLPSRRSREVLAPAPFRQSSTGPTSRTRRPRAGQGPQWQSWGDSVEMHCRAPGTARRGGGGRWKAATGGRTTTQPLPPSGTLRHGWLTGWWAAGTVGHVWRRTGFRGGRCGVVAMHQNTGQFAMQARNAHARARTVRAQTCRYVGNGTQKKTVNSNQKGNFFCLCRHYALQSARERNGSVTCQSQTLALIPRPPRLGQSHNKTR